MWENSKAFKRGPKASFRIADSVLFLFTSAWNISPENARCSFRKWILTDMKRMNQPLWVTALKSRGRATSKLYNNLRMASLELLCPLSHNSQKPVLREGEKQGNHDSFYYYSLRDYPFPSSETSWRGYDSNVIPTYLVIFSFPCMSSSSSPVRSCKPPPAVAARSTVFHTQPDYTARKPNTFCLSWTSFCWFQTCTPYGSYYAEQSNPIASMLLIVSYASICMEIHSTQAIMCSYNFFLHIHYSTFIYTEVYVLFHHSATQSCKGLL